MKIVLTDELKEEVVKYYLSKPMTMEDVRVYCGLSRPTIAKILNEYNVNRYTKAKIFNPDLNEDYFEIIDTPNKAYFLGLIIADGNVFEVDDSSNRQSSISITLKECDKYILEKFKEEVCLNTSVSFDGRGCCYIAIRSNKMAQDLRRYGIHPRKTFDSILPNIQNELIPHLLRGLFDGDGCIQAHQTDVNNRYKHSVGWCGTKQLMEQIRDWLVENLNVTNISVYSYKTRSLSMVTWANIDDIQTICKCLYDNANIYLLRKHNLYNEFVQHYNL